uniref:Uncharacterized protein n=1 Tax=viral metagenome TaxID=1070528 RepID=A0A6C0KXL7_9ZZZZ
MTSSNDFSEMQDRNVQTLSDIQGLQTIEKGLFSNLEAGIANNTLTQEQKDSLIGKINEISNMRVNLYKNLNGMYGFFQKNMDSTRDTVSEQKEAINIVERELNDAKRRLEIIQQENNNKIRLVEINTYYGDQYSDYANIMKLIVYFSVPILICTILANSGILPNMAFMIIAVTIVTIAVFYIGRQVITIFSKDTMNYSEYDWHTDKSKLPEVTTDDPSGEDPWVGTAVACTADACCPEGYGYSAVDNKCISSELLAESTSMQESAETALAAYMENSRKKSSNGYPPMGGYGSL